MPHGCRRPVRSDNNRRQTAPKQEQCSSQSLILCSYAWELPPPGRVCIAILARRERKRFSCRPFPIKSRGVHPVGTAQRRRVDLERAKNAWLKTLLSSSTAKNKPNAVRECTQKRSMRVKCESGLLACNVYIRHTFHACDCE